MAGSAGPGPYYAWLARNKLWYNHFLQRAGTVQNSPTSLAQTWRVQYCSSASYAAVAAWAATTVYSVGNIIRQNATPTVNNERCFICISPGTSGGSEPAWSTGATVTYGSVWNDNGVIWQEITGQSAYGWHAPHARLSNACNGLGWQSPGDWVYVGNNHAETQAAAMTISPVGTNALPTSIICVNVAGNVPPQQSDVTTGATITATGGAGSINMLTVLVNSATYVYGVGFIFNLLSTICSTQNSYVRFENCYFQQSASVGLFFGNSSVGAVELVNTYCYFVGTTGIQLRIGYFSWTNTPNAVQGTTLPTVLLTPVGSSILSTINLDGVDLSSLTTGKSIYSLAGSASTLVTLLNCKLGSGVTLTSGSNTGQGQAIVTAVNCDSANTNYRYYKQVYQGVITHETTVVRTGGATDGTTPISRKMVSSANSLFYSPLVSDPIIYWNESLSPITLTVPIVTETAGNQGRVPPAGLTNQDAWIEVEYLGTSGYPLGVLALGNRATNILSTPTYQPIDGTSVWGGGNNSGLSAPVQQSLSVTFTPITIGPIKVVVKLARPNVTMWFDPIVVTSARQWSPMPGLYINEADDPSPSNVLSGVIYNQGDTTGTASGGSGGNLIGC